MAGGGLARTAGAPAEAPGCPGCCGAAAAELAGGHEGAAASWEERRLPPPAEAPPAPCAMEGGGGPGAPPPPPPPPLLACCNKWVREGAVGRWAIVGSGVLHQATTRREPSPLPPCHGAAAPWHAASCTCTCASCVSATTAQQAHDDAFTTRARRPCHRHSDGKLTSRRDMYSRAAFLRSAALISLAPPPPPPPPPSAAAAGAAGGAGGTPPPAAMPGAAPS